VQRRPADGVSRRTHDEHRQPEHHTGSTTPRRGRRDQRVGKLGAGAIRGAIAVAAGRAFQHHQRCGGDRLPDRTGARHPGGKAQRHHGHHASDTDANVANGTQNDQTAAGTQSGTSAASGANSTGQQTPGGVLLTDLMRGLQAYGATTTLM